MQDNWVDFKVVKEAVTMEMILGRYGVNWLRKSKDELRGRCPVHQGDGESAFHVSLSRSAFNWFSCKARGNVLDFVAAMEKCSVRDAALKLADWFANFSAASRTLHFSMATTKSRTLPRALHENQLNALLLKLT